MAVYSLDATQLAQLSMVSSISGMFSSAAGSYYAAQAQKSALEFDASMADLNANMAERSAQFSFMKRDRQTAQITSRAGQIKSSQRASMAANGIDLGVGNAAEVQASTDIMKEVDMNQINSNAVNEAWGYKTQAVNFKNSALMSRAKAGSVSPWAAVGTSMINSASSVASSWYQFAKAAPTDVATANASADPIYSLGQSRNWFNY